MAEKRHISVAPSFAHSLITAQAGTLSKAVLEGIMNSKDAGATEVKIDIDAKGITIIDNGRGFLSREEILEVFEVLGFEHPTVDDRVYGKFGIGRAQLWAFASTIWRSNAFEMDVDIQRRGLDYDLHEDRPVVPGVAISGTFYKKMLTSELISFERELIELALYAPLTVLLNGKSITKNPADEKWIFETEDAYIRLKDGGQLTVYNNGIKVRDYPAAHLGSGGAVLTKPGVRLALNTARSDILVSQCKTWARIRRFVQKQSDTRLATKTTRVTDDELENRARRFVGRELPLHEIADTKFITDITGRGHTLEMFVRQAGGYRAGGVVTVTEKGSRMGERAHRGKMAFVLAPLTLDRFNVRTPTELKALLLNVVLSRAAPRPRAAR